VGRILPGKISINPWQNCFGYGGLIVTPPQKLRFREVIGRMTDDLIEARDWHEFTPPIGQVIPPMMLFPPRPTPAARRGS
jgi:hypothetical protein